MKNSFLFITFLLIFSLTLVSASEISKVKGFNVNDISQEKFKVVIERRDNSIAKMDSGVNTNIKYELLEVTKKDLLRLEEDSNILNIYSQNYIHAFLEEATSVIQSGEVNNLQYNFYNLTGTGEVVCVIDSGVDFTHPDLFGKNLSCVVDCYNKACVENCSVGDDNGHGTHVAGIVAASGGITGVAPNVSLIGVKILGSSGGGSGNDSDLNNAVDYCVSQNVSVITMSLGTINFYSSECDNVGGLSSWRDSLNAAVAKNISVVVATGNDGNLTSISAPACFHNATPVGDTYDSNLGEIIWSVCRDSTTIVDKIVCHANRNSLLKLLAPGALINSTYLGNGYNVEGGTSMATPMVAGTIAILNQYFNLSGLTKTPAEIENLLYETGKVISENGINYSRIDLYSAISEMSNLSINQTSPSNDTYTNIANTNFTCVANSSILDLVNMTFYFYNSTGDLLSTLNESISGTDNSSTLNYTFPYDDIYSWGCKAYTENSASATSDNRTITYDSTLPTVNLSNETLFSTIDLSFNFSEDVNYTLNYSGEIENSSSYINSSTINLNGLNSYTEYVMNLTFCDWAGNCNFTEFNLTTLPIFVNLTSPFNISYTNVNDTNFTCEINSTDSANLTNITFFLYNSTGDLIYNSTNILDGFYNLSIFNYTLENESNYSWTCVAYNNISESYSPVNYTVFYDVTSPSVNLTNPNASFSYLILNLSEETNYSVTGSITNSSSNYNSSYVIPFDGSCGAKTYSLTFCDRAGNCNTTSQGFTASVCPSNTGGGSPRSSASNYREPEEGTESNPIVLEDIGSISRKTLTLNNSFYFEVGNNETHNITLTHITNEYVIIEIHSKYVSLNLTENSSQKVDIDSDDNYDLEVLVGKITNTTVDITLKKIEFAKEKDKILSNQTEEFNDNLNNSVKNHTWIYFVIGGILLIILIYFIFYHNKLSLRIKELRLNKLHTKNHSENSEE